MDRGLWTVFYNSLLINCHKTSNPLTGTIVSRLSVSVTYTAVPEGTKITTVVEGEPKGFFKLAEGLVVSSLEKNLEEDQNHLKAILEGV